MPPDQNSKGVPRNQNRALTTISQSISPGAFCIRPGSLISVRSGVVCPDCRHMLTSIVEFARSYPFDDVLEVHVKTRKLYCTHDGCATDEVLVPLRVPPPDHKILTSPSQPELLESARGF